MGLLGLGLRWSGSGTTGTDSSGAGATNTLGSASGISSQSASSFTGGGAPFVGVGVPKEGDSITILNEQTTYNTWEFIYDPRIEQLYAKGALFGGGASGLGRRRGIARGLGRRRERGVHRAGLGVRRGDLGVRRVWVVRRGRLRVLRLLLRSLRSD